MGSKSSLENRIELGTVAWLKAEDYQTALEQSKNTGKPIFLLFQEIPGCSTCTTFGSAVLSNSTIVDIIAKKFVAVAVYNNKMIGSDASLLKHFNEPSWNNPVVRFINNKGEDIIPRKDGVYSTGGIASRMSKVLQICKQEVPTELESLCK